MSILMTINGASQLPLVRLMHLVSPSLPIGSFTYSQGIEWAVEYGWIKTVTDLKTWLNSQLTHSVTYVDIPIVVRLYQAVERRDWSTLDHWVEVLLANRETHELLLEENNRGRALTDLLIALQIPHARDLKSTLIQSQAAGFVLAAQYWQIPLEQTLYGYVWSWLENLVLSAVKIIPLGQTHGQQCLYELSPLLEPAIQIGQTLSDDELGASSFALALASSRHEAQYTRLFRS